MIRYARVISRLIDNRMKVIRKYTVMIMSNKEVIVSADIAFINAIM